MANALASLADVKAWGEPIQNTNDNALLTRLIAQASRAIYAYLTTNTLFLQTFSDAYDGVNNTRIILTEWPVVSVDSVYINSQLIPEAPSQPQIGAGWRLDQYNGVPPGRPQAVDLYGHRFWKGYQNVYITYSAGYAINNEAHTIPASAPYTITTTQTYGRWSQDDGVTDSNGVVFVSVMGSPAAGQYCIDISTGVYTFNASDASKNMLISYSYTPADIEQACIEMVRERYAYKQRMGQKSKSLSGTETAKYDLSAMSEYVTMLLQPYKRTNVA